MAIEHPTFADTTGTSAKLNVASDLQIVLGTRSEGWLYFDGNFCREAAAKQAALYAYYGTLPPDPYGHGRKRAYLKLRMDISSGKLSVATVQSYSQSFEYNEQDGGKIRIFHPIPADFIIGEGGALNALVTKNLRLIRQLFRFSKKTVTIGVHVVRYDAASEAPATSSPPWLHRDQEPVVVLNVVAESPHLVGGDSVFARLDRTIIRVVHLEPFEAVLLLKNGLHAVTPMAPSPGYERALRDILLTTVEEADSVITSR